MEELFRYYLENIIILRIGTGLRYLWLRFVRHRKIGKNIVVVLVNGHRINLDGKDLDMYLRTFHLKM